MNCHPRQHEVSRPRAGVAAAWIVLALGLTMTSPGEPAAPEIIGRFELSSTAAGYDVWGGGTQRRAFAEEMLPACFERTLELEALAGEQPARWIFTGPRAGVTVSLRTNEVRLSWRFYDSPAFAEIAGKAGRHPEWAAPELPFAASGRVQSVTLRLDGRLQLALFVNGREVHRREWMHDLSRHQIQVEGRGAAAKGRWTGPAAREVSVRVDPSRHHQAMIGFGGIAAPTAYARLSEAGKAEWWRLLAEYNLLIQREYPIGRRLNPAMDNWDRLADATPHYYGDNFPNGEVSDFAYNRRLRELGGQVWFEFWQLPPWVGTNVERYAEAMVAYCRAARDRAGGPPDLVGVQNEVRQSPEQWRAMTLALRRTLDANGFSGVRIHMADASRLNEGLDFMRGFQRSPEAWAAIDYAASHLYDFQDFFVDPDGFDARIAAWRAAAGDKPFLSTELCINNSKYQADSYRLALAMGQLYHKNLVLLDAAAVCYCWLLLDVVQPSYGATRSLFVPDAQNGLVPAASSHQLRTFGAYSRRIVRGMTRVEAESGDPDLLVTAFAGGGGRATLVALNRGVRPLAVRVDWPGARFAERETADPYRPNLAQPPDGAGPMLVEPGAIVTLTSVPPGRPLEPGARNPSVWKGNP